MAAASEAHVFIARLPLLAENTQPVILGTVNCFVIFLSMSLCLLNPSPLGFFLVFKTIRLESELVPDGRLWADRILKVTLTGEYTR